MSSTMGLTPGASKDELEQEFAGNAAAAAAPAPTYGSIVTDPSASAALTPSQQAADALQTQSDAQVSSLDRLSGNQWDGSTSHLTPQQSAAAAAKPVVDTGVPTGPETFVTVPVDKVFVTPQGKAQATPLYAAGAGYKAQGPTPPGGQ